MKRLFLFAIIFLTVLCSCGNSEKPKENRDSAALQEEETMTSLAARIAKARDLEAKGQHEEALEIANGVLKKYPAQLDALGVQADVLKAQGKADEALKVLEKAYALQPRDKETAYNLAYEYADAKNAKALALTDTLIRYDKTETVARAWYTKGYYYNRLGNDGEAIRYYDSSLASDYNFLDAYLDKGQLQYKQKKYDAALKTFALGQKVSPAAAEFYLWVAKTQEAMGDRINAKTNYERAAALNKDLNEAKEAAERLK